MLRGETRETIYLAELEATFERYNVPKGYLHLIKTIPRYWTLNPLAVSIALKVHESVGKPTVAKVKAEINSNAQEYLLTPADLLRYYRLIQRFSS